MKRIPHDPKEIIAVVDDKDHIIGKNQRKNHAEGKLHREVAVLLVNKDNEVLLQTRDDKSLGLPLFLDYSAGGHFPYNNSYLDGAVRETFEELGLSLPRSKFRKVAKRRLTSVYGKRRNDRFCTLYEIRGDYELKDIKMDSTEVKSIKFYPLEKLGKILKKEQHKGGFRTMAELYLKKSGF